MQIDNIDLTVAVDDAVLVLALAGDLSMGQPPDQSIRAARLAVRLAAADGAGADGCANTRLVALLRWSGCTANAAGFASLLGDDVGGRHAMLAHTLPPGHPLTATTVTPLAHVHCDVAGQVARLLALPAEVETGLRQVFEHHDGRGLPEGLGGDAILPIAHYASLSGDLDILARAHGIDAALDLLAGMAGTRYPARLVGRLLPHARAWLAELDDEAPRPPAADETRRVPLSLVADTIELKLPWLAGHSRRVADLVAGAARRAGLKPDVQQCLARAALLHGMGRAAVPNTVWERDGRLGSADWERVRLAPYWTARAAVQVPALRHETLLASHAYERLDGSGYFRSLDAAALDLPRRLLAAAVAFTALCAPRPWRPACHSDDAARLLAGEADQGRFDADSVRLVAEAASGKAHAADAGEARKSLLSERETDVLRRISMGESNKEAARVMGISPSTVRTHVESIFRKLDCSTRAAATLKALTLGLI